ncbi:unnamed protein product, partial [Brachionus calyciflorus]
DYSTYNLPCRHILFVRKSKDIPIIEPSMINERWKNKIFEKSSVNQEQNKIINSNGRRTIQMSNMNRIQSSEFLSPTKSKFFECHRMQIMLQIKELWESSVDFTIKPIIESNLANKRIEINQEDLSRYESIIQTDSDLPCCSNSNNQVETNLVDSISTSSETEEENLNQNQNFVKIDLTGKSFVKSAPKRGAPTKAQRKRKQ